MKGTLVKRDKGDWVVCWTDSTAKNGARILPLHPDDCQIFNTNGDSQSCTIEFEIIEQFIPYDNFKPIHKFAKILTIEEDELKDWDVTLNDGLENEPFISDDFQIGPDGAYEHIEEENTLTPKEKAKELVDKFSNECLLTIEGGKVAALISVDEIKRILYSQGLMILYDYWFEVKKEIEK